MCGLSPLPPEKYDHLTIQPLSLSLSIRSDLLSLSLNLSLSFDATGAFLLSPASAAVTGVTMYVDNGMHAMGMVQNVAVAQVAE